MIIKTPVGISHLLNKTIKSINQEDAYLVVLQMVNGEVYEISGLIDEEGMKLTSPSINPLSIMDTRCRGCLVRAATLRQEMDTTFNKVALGLSLESGEGEIQEWEIEWVGTPYTDLDSYLGEITIRLLEEVEGG